MLLKCHTGCSVETILAAIGKTKADLFEPKQKARIAATYDYTDENGALLFQIVRFDPKDFRARRPDGAGEWVWNLRGVPRVLYRLPEVLAAVAAGDTVWIVEGEKDADALCARQLVATTNPVGGGSKKWKDEYSEVLRGADVRIIADADETGRAHALEIRESLQRVAGVEPRIFEAAAGKDAFDHLAAGLGIEDLVESDATPKPQANGHAPESKAELALAFPEEAFSGTFALVRDALRENTGACPAHVFAATWCALATAIGSKVIGHFSGRVIPQTYVLSLGPVNDYKSSAASGALEILDVQRCSPASAAGLFDELAGRRAMLLYADEWAELKAKIEYSGGSELRAVLNDLWGAPPYLLRQRSKAVKHNQERSNRIDFPRLAILANGHVDGFWQKAATSDLLSGFLSRFAFFVGTGSEFLPITRPVPESAKEGGRQLLTRINWMSETAIELSRAAEGLWSDFSREEFQRVAAMRDDRALMHRRVVGHVARLALVYAVDTAHEAVEEDDLARAILVGRYLTACANALFDSQEPEMHRGEARQSYIEETIDRIRAKKPEADAREIREAWPNKRTRPPMSAIRRFLQ